jgi:hypothetical protein
VFAGKRTVHISDILIVTMLSEGVSACKAVRGIPGDAVLVDARFEPERASVALDFFSFSWTEDGEDFVPLFERDPADTRAR